MDAMRSADRAHSTQRAQGLSKAFPVADLLGVVLVGGASRRMGIDKALLDWAGRPLAAHVAAIVARVVPRVVLIGGSGRGYERLGRPWLPDPPGLAGRGPLAGLVAALRVAPRVLVVACDLPHLEPVHLARFLFVAGTAPVAMPAFSGERREPLVGRYGREALPAALRLLATGSGRMTDLLAVNGARLVPAGALGPASDVEWAFTNLNRPADVKATQTL
jgi:molybdopterin-guanine dinucleotide biosynthesis protein A